MVPTLEENPVMEIRFSEIAVRPFFWYYYPFCHQNFTESDDFDRTCFLEDIAHIEADTIDSSKLLEDH